MLYLFVYQTQCYQGPTHDCHMAFLTGIVCVQDASKHCHNKVIFVTPASLVVFIHTYAYNHLKAGGWYLHCEIACVNYKLNRGIAVSLRMRGAHVSALPLLRNIDSSVGGSSDQEEISCIALSIPSSYITNSPLTF